MRRLLLGIALALLIASISSESRPSSVLHSAEQAKETAKTDKKDSSSPSSDKDKAESEAKSKTAKSGGGQYKIQLEVNFVTTDVTIIGQAPPDLNEDDFIIYDDGVAQPASYFSLDQIPLAVAILIDASLSIEPFVDELQIAGLSALVRLKPEDKVVLYQFNRLPERLTDLTDDRLLIASQINRLDIQFMTNIWDTLYEAADYLNRQAPGYRKALILISDNMHVGDSRYDPDYVQNELLEDAVTLLNIRAVGTNDAYTAQWAVSDQEVMRLVTVTGGEQFRVNSTTSLQQALSFAITKLRKQYTLGFNPPTESRSGVFHKLTIKFAKPNRCPGCLIRSRSGYYSGVTAPRPPQYVANLQRTLSASQKAADEMLIRRFIAASVSRGIDYPDVPFNVDIQKQTDDKGNPELKLDLLIAFDRIGTTVVDDKHQCKMRVLVFYGKEGDLSLQSRGAVLAGDLTDENYNQLLKKGYPFSISVPLVSKKQLLKVLVFDEETKNMGIQTIHYDETE